MVKYVARRSDSYLRIVTTILHAKPELVGGVDGEE